MNSDKRMIRNDPRSFSWSTIKMNMKHLDDTFNGQFASSEDVYIQILDLPSFNSKVYC